MSPGVVEQLTDDLEKISSQTVQLHFSVPTPPPSQVPWASFLYHLCSLYLCQLLTLSVTHFLTFAIKVGRCSTRNNFSKKFSHILQLELNFFHIRLLEELHFLVNSKLHLELKDLSFLRNRLQISVKKSRAAIVERVRDGKF